MEIVRRVVTAILAVLVFPAFLCFEFIIFRLGTPLTEYGMIESITGKRLIDIITGKDELFSALQSFFSGGEKFTWPTALDPVKGAIICTVVFLFLAFIAAVFIVVWSAVTDNRWGSLIASVLGVCFIIAMKISLSKAAAPIIDGTIGLGSIGDESIINSLVGGLVEVTHITTGGAITAMIICFGAIAVWQAIYWISEIGLNEEEKAAERSHHKKH